MNIRSVRVSKPAVRSVLEKYLSDDLAEDIFREIVEQDEDDARNSIGMTVGEFLDRFEPDDLSIVWADDTKAGFGRRGDSVYGNNKDCVICCINESMHKVTLHVWCKPLTSDLAYVNAAMKEYYRRHPEEVQA